MYNILILGMGGEVSKGIYKALKLSGIPCKIVGACISEESEGLYFCDKAFVSPYASDFKFVDWLVDICNRESIDIVLTGVEENIWAISTCKQYLQSKCEAVFRVCTPEQLKIGGDKLETCRWLESNRLPFPKYAASEDRCAVNELMGRCGFPLIAKPRRGKGSVGIVKINCQEDLTPVLEMTDYVVQECIGTEDEEYTVGCYRGLTGYTPEPIVMKRKLRHGSSWKVEVVENEIISSYAKKICQLFQPDGPLNIQLRLNDDGVPVPFELNVRFSGTTPMRANFGFCDVKAMIFESLMDKNIHDLFHIKKGIAYRYTEELYLESPAESTENGLRWTLLKGD